MILLINHPETGDKCDRALCIWGYIFIHDFTYLDDCMLCIELSTENVSLQSEKTTAMSSISVFTCKIERDELNKQVTQYGGLAK